MSENDPETVEREALSDEKQSDARKPRGIRFSDSEWEKVKAAAERRGIPAAEFVRDTAVGIARNETGVASAAIPPGVFALIEQTYRNAYILATLKRDEMHREGRGGEMDRMVNTARAAQAELLRPA